MIQLALDGKIISTDIEKCVRDFINELPAADVQPNLETIKKHFEIVEW